jgi:hypothetical protein
MAFPYFSRKGDNMKIPSTHDWRTLPPDKQIYYMTAIFIKTHTEAPLFVNRKPSMTFYKIRHFFDKLYSEKGFDFMNMLYEMAYSSQYEVMTITEFINNAQDLKEKRLKEEAEKFQKMVENKNQKVTIYDVLGVN